MLMSQSKYRPSFPKFQGAALKSPMMWPGRSWTIFAKIVLCQRRGQTGSLALLEENL